jgi:hypothetical protein
VVSGARQLGLRHAWQLVPGPALRGETVTPPAVLIGVATEKGENALLFHLVHKLAQMKYGRQ